MGDKKRDEKERSDPRVAATSSIGVGTIVALVALVVLFGITRSPSIAFVVIGGAALAIAGNWIFGRSKTEAAKSTEIAKLEATIEDLKERLENVEVINRYETTLAERALEEEQASKPRSMGPRAES